MRKERKKEYIYLKRDGAWGLKDISVAVRGLLFSGPIDQNYTIFGLKESSSMSWPIKSGWEKCVFKKASFNII